MSNAELMIRIRASAEEAQAAFKQVGAGLDGIDTKTARVGRTAGAARADVGNLTAQFQDIGVMLAAGQSPLQLAVQQGSQISQVLGPMGAAGAARALGSAFLSLISPVTFITIGAIAAGAAFFQWMTSSEEETKSLQDAVSDLGNSIDEMERAASSNLADLRSAFGEVTPEIEQLNERLGDLANIRAITAAADAVRSLRAETEGGWFSYIVSGETGQLADFLGVPEVTGPGGRGPYANQLNPAVEGVKSTLDALGETRNVREMIDLLVQYQDQIRVVVGDTDNLTLDQARVLSLAADTEKSLRRLAGIQDGSAERERVLSEYTSRTGELLDLEQSRVTVQQELQRASAEGDTAAAERASTALANIEEQIAKTTEADDRIAAMRESVDRLQRAIGQVEFDGSDQVRARIAEAVNLLDDAAAGTVDLNDADLTKLEGQLRGIVGLANGFLRAIGLSIDELEGGAVSGAYDFYRRYEASNPGATDRGAYARGAAEVADRGILDLIGYAEGTDRGRGYNETLGYGAFTGGDVNLVNMTLREVRQLQDQMLAHPDNSLNSSAVGRYQIVGRTLESLIGRLGLSRDEQFTPELQDRLALELVRGRQGQGTAGMRNEWEGLRNIAPDTITAALGSDPVPTVDPVVVRERERAAREATQENNRHAREVEQTKKAYDRLMGSLSETTAAELEFAEGQRVIAQALEDGTITADEAARAQARLRTHFQEVAEALNPAREQIEGFADDLASAGAGAVVRGENLRDNLAQVFQGIAFDILQSGIRDSIINVLTPSLGGGSGGGFLSNIVSAVTGVSFGAAPSVPAGPRFGGGRASGGRVAAGEIVMTSELGAELFMADRPGTIIPNHKLPTFASAAEQALGARAGGGASALEVRLSPGLVASILRQAAGTSVRIAEVSAEQQSRAFDASAASFDERGTS